VRGSRSSLLATVSARPINANDRLGSSRNAASYNLRASLRVVSDPTASISCIASARQREIRRAGVRDRLRKNTPPLGVQQRAFHLNRQPRDEFVPLACYARRSMPTSPLQTWVAVPYP
jgi:hypothetical protein